MDDWTQPFVGTDYSNSPMDPERIKILQSAEREYINGVPDDEGNVEWPTYRGLAQKFAIPVRVINEQAAKHRWNARRERRKGQLVYFKQQQQMRQWQEMDREYTAQAAEALHKLQFVHNRKAHELYEEAVTAWSKDADAASKGRRELNKMDIKMNELRTLTASIKDLNEAQAARANRAQALPLGYEDVASPAELPTAIELHNQPESTEKANLTSIEDVLRLMVDTQNKYMDLLDGNRNIIEGEVVTDDV